jgi:hypothetical protein
MEKVKYKELEHVIINERKVLHDTQFMQQDLVRQNEELSNDLER